jgi:DNA replication protein DnaC
MSLPNPTRETIKLYAKQLRTPSFMQYDDVVRQLDAGQGYDHFLRDMMKREVEQRQENQQRRRIKAAKFPFTKTLDEFDFSRLEHVSSATLWELASGDFIASRQNIVMIGNPGAGNYRRKLVMERN